MKKNSDTAKSDRVRPDFPQDEKTVSEREAEELAFAQSQIVKNMTAGMTLWFSALKSYQSMVDLWVDSREKALVKTLHAVQKLGDLPNDDAKIDKMADIIVDQLSTFQRDLLSVQMKTAARMSSLSRGINRPEDIVNKFGNATPADFEDAKQDKDVDKHQE